MRIEFLYNPHMTRNDGSYPTHRIREYDVAID